MGEFKQNTTLGDKDWEGKGAEERYSGERKS
jgi:hypothetical protein